MKAFHNDTSDKKRLEQYQPKRKTWTRRVKCLNHATKPTVRNMQNIPKNQNVTKGLCLHKGKCILQDIAIAPNVINVLDRPIAEGYKFMKKLTNEELDFCIKNETRKSGLAKLKKRLKQGEQNYENTR